MLLLEGYYSRNIVVYRMNRWGAIKEIQKYSIGLKELIYYFEEYPEQAREYNEDNVKCVRFVLPLRMSIFFPIWSIAVMVGKRHEVNFEIVDIKKIEIEQKREEWIPYRSIHKPSFTIKCTKESEIKSALSNLRKSKNELNRHLENVYRYLPMMRSF